jgi:hypothetical protein
MIIDIKCIKELGFSMSIVFYPIRCIFLRAVETPTINEPNYWGRLFLTLLTQFWLEIPIQE